MLVYLSVMLLCCILLYAMRYRENKVLPLATVFSLIWLMVSLQEGWGGDHDAYVYLFDQLKGQSFVDLLSDESHGELGYKILMWFLPSSHMAMVLGIAIWCYSLAFFFYHFVPQKWWYFAILFVFFDKAILMGMVASFCRMALANSCLIFAIYYVWKRKRAFAALLIFLGSFFHLSVLFFLPLIFVGQRQVKIHYLALVGIFAFIAVFFILSPTSWTDLVESIITSTDTFEGYEYYLEEQGVVKSKGLSFLILFYWILLLSKMSYRSDLNGKEYFMLYLALIRIAFDFLPAVGLSSRFFYFIDIYFFAGMMVLLNRLPYRDVNIWGIVFTLLLMFGYFGFYWYAISDFYHIHWMYYNFIF